MVRGRQQSFAVFYQGLGTWYKAIRVALAFTDSWTVTHMFFVFCCTLIMLSVLHLSSHTQIPQPNPGTHTYQRNKLSVGHSGSRHSSVWHAEARSSQNFLWAHDGPLPDVHTFDSIRVPSTAKETSYIGTLASLCLAGPRKKSCPPCAHLRSMTLS